MWARATVLTVGVALFLAGCGGVQHFGPQVLANGTEGAPPPLTATGHLLAAFERAMDMVDELRFDEALVKLTELEPLIAGVGDRQRAALCLFWRGFCEEKLSRPAQAGARYRDVMEIYPDTVAAALAHRRLAILDAPDT